MHALVDLTSIRHIFNAVARLFSPANEVGLAKSAKPLFKLCTGICSPMLTDYAASAGVSSSTSREIKRRSSGLPSQCNTFSSDSVGWSRRGSKGVILAILAPSSPPRDSSRSLTGRTSSSGRTEVEMKAQLAGAGVQLSVSNLVQDEKKGKSS